MTTRRTMRRPARACCRPGWTAVLLQVLVFARADCQATTATSGPAESVTLPSSRPLMTCFVEKFTDTVCQDNYWPSSEVPEIIPELGIGLPMTLTIRDLTLQGDGDLVMPIGALVNLTSVGFHRITNTDPQAEFPFQRLVSRLDKASLSDLGLKSVGRLNIGADYFAGFSGLLRLTITKCSLVGLHRDSFLPLARPAGAGLLQLTIEEDRHLAQFHWEVLTPVAGSIESIVLSENYKLSEIVALPNSSASSGLKFPKLKNLDVSFSKVKSLPEFVLASYTRCNSTAAYASPNPTDAAASDDDRYTTCQLTFRRNRSNCSDCATFGPLVTWVKGGGWNRFAKVTCDEPNSKDDELTGDSIYWDEIALCEG